MDTNFPRMRKCLLIGLALSAAGLANAQMYTDDFESYNVNDYMGVVNPTHWSTWSGSVGGSEDVRVTAANASSGTKSLYFNSTASGGGPQDVLLKFGGTYTSGTLVYQTDMLIPNGKSAYFNFQATPVAGQTWALEVNFANGSISMGGNASGPYTPDAWFTLRIEANLTLGRWEFFVDGVSQGIWSNPVNSVAMADIYPLQGSSFYIDDVMLDYTPYTLTALNAGAGGLDLIGNVAGQSVFPSARIRNAGTSTITSFDVTLDYNGTQVTENVTGISLASLADYTVDFSSSIQLVAGTNVAMLSVDNVNGAGQDNDPNDDVLNLNVTPIVPAAGKMVVGEEATGTWCQWCPRGAVYMEKWKNRYAGFFAPIAVHNNDPMANVDYDAGVAALISGYPSSLVDRVSDVDPSAMLGDIETRLQTAPAGLIQNGAAWDANTRELTISLTTTFAQSSTTPYRVACVITEDSVTGTTSGYNQSNAYAGGGNGPMGGYENLPASVPAALMVYDFVARGIAPSFDGMQNAFPASIAASTGYTQNFTFTLPQDWDETRMHIVGMLIEPNGQINNASHTTIDEAVANGLILGGKEAVSTLLDGPDQRLKVYPNPAHGNAFALLDIKGSSQVAVTLYDLTGKAVYQHAYGQLTGAHTLTLPLENLPAGLYQLAVQTEGQTLTRKIVVE